MRGGQEAPPGFVRRAVQARLARIGYDDHVGGIDAVDIFETMPTLLSRSRGSVQI